jgi:sugar phosphate isomerase/epimerase
VVPGLDLTLAPLGFLELDPPTFVSVAGAAAFRSVGLRVAPAVPGGIHHPLATGGAELRETALRLGDTGVGVLQVELVSLHRASDLARMRPLLETGAALGATRVVACGDDPDLSATAARLAELADLAAEYGIAVDLEFMPFRALASLEQALAVVAAAGRDDVVVMVDALHLARSGGTPAEVAAADPRRLAVLQLCDAPRDAPPAELLADEARCGRLLPGDGELSLAALVAAMPPAALFAAEVPLAGTGWTPLERARAAHAATARLVTQAAQWPA